jgi:hypothetical protein
VIVTSINNGQVGQSINFDGQSSYDIDPGDTITSYAWNFGDGTSLVSGLSHVPHAYAIASTAPYIVSLTATDSHQTTNTTTVSILISVPPAPSVNDAEFVAQSQIPTSMTTGQQLGVWVKIKNTGTGTWQSSANNPHRLGSQNPQDNSNWGLNRVSLPSDVSSNQEATFSSPSPRR